MDARASWREARRVSSVGANATISFPSACSRDGGNIPLYKSIPVERWLEVHTLQDGRYTSGRRVAGNAPIRQAPFADAGIEPPWLEI